MSTQPSLWCRIALRQRPLTPKFSLQSKQTARQGRDRSGQVSELLALFERLAQTAHHSFLAEHHHRVKQWRGDGRADNGHTRRVDQQTGFYAGVLGYFPRGVVASVVVPLRQGPERIRECPEKLGYFCVFPEFRFGGGIASEIVAGKSPRPA